MLPANAKVQYRNLIDKQAEFTKSSEESGYNKYIDGTDKKLGIITTGIAYNYLMENFPGGKCPYPIVKITQYPLPYAFLSKLYDECEEILVLEDGQPFVEELMKGFLGKGKKVMGRLDETIRRDGEMNAEKVAKALGMPVKTGAPIPSVVTNRPPALCQGGGSRPSDWCFVPNIPHRPPSEHRRRYNRSHDRHESTKHPRTLPT